MASDADTGGESGRNYERMRHFHRDARAHFEQGDLALARERTEDALEIALALEDERSIMALLSLRGSVYLSLLEPREAVEDFGDLVALLRARREERRADSLAHAAAIAVEVQALAHCAGQYLLLGMPANTDGLLREARGLLARDVTSDVSAGIPNRALIAATVEYVQALADSWHGDVDAALARTLQSAAVLRALGSPQTAARAEIAAADALVDMAQKLPLATDRFRLAEASRTHLRAALELARRCGDVCATSLGLITNARVERVLGNDADNIAVLEHVAYTGERLGDMALLTQALSVLGDEWYLRGQPESARTCYQLVLTLLESADLSGLGVWAQRGMLRI